MPETTPEERFALSNRALVVAPAGCGKTELIARAVACQNDGRQLILTHTHAGIKSLKDRLQRLGVSASKYRLDTIAGFALKYAAAYPRTADIQELRPRTQTDWDAIYSGALTVLQRSWVKRVVSSTYSGLFVDEYQDCSKAQHSLVMELAESLPCRIVGDPLQGVFDFDDLVNWQEDILPYFERLPDLDTAWRWVSTNSKLGNWLLSVRHSLEQGEPIDLSRAPMHWIPKTPPNPRIACLNLFNREGSAHSIVAIHKWDKQAHRLAQSLSGTYTSMEEVESKDLQEYAHKLSTSVGTDRAVLVIRFAACCMTKVSTELERIESRLQRNDLDFPQKLKHSHIGNALKIVAQTRELRPVRDALALIEQIPGRVLYRRELWTSMKRSLMAVDGESTLSLEDAAWAERDRGRRWGRRVDHTTVSRVLLIKGLEFDHAIVLDADILSTKELYVAMTRGSRSLTVLSEEPIVQPLRSKHRT